MGGIVTGGAGVSVAYVRDCLRNTSSHRFLWFNEAASLRSEDEERLLEAAA